MRQKTTGWYKEIQFATCAILIGLGINIRKTSTDAAMTRINKELASRELIKHIISTAKQIKNKVKVDLRSAAIGSIMKYGLTTPRARESADKKPHQFSSKRVSRCIHAQKCLHPQWATNTWRIQKKTSRLWQQMPYLNSEGPIASTQGKCMRYIDGEQHYRLPI